MHDRSAGWSYWSTGLIRGSHSKNLCDTQPELKVGDVVTVGVDMDAKQMHFIVNGKLREEATISITQMDKEEGEEVFFCVCVLSDPVDAETDTAYVAISLLYHQ